MSVHILLRSSEWRGLGGGDGWVVCVCQTNHFIGSTLIAELTVSMIWQLSGTGVCVFFSSLFLSLSYEIHALYRTRTHTPLVWVVVCRL